MTTLSQSLRDDNRDVWDAMQQHRFVRDIEADRLPDDVFARYLVFEHAFVETAILIFGHAMLSAPGFPQRRWLIGVLHALAEDQIGYFSRSFAELGVTPLAPEEVLPAAVEAFASGMLEIAAAGRYHDTLAIMLAAEWMYATWCSRANAVPISSPELKRWVALHAEPAFLDQAAWLRAEIDGAPPPDRDRLSALFRRALLLEIDFHSAPYETSWSARR